MMKSYARAIDGVVVELFATDGDIADYFPSDFGFIECDESVQQGWLYVDQVFSSPKISEPKPTVPMLCSPAQGLVALFALKQITEDHVLEAIAQIPDPVQQYTARIGYQRATTWERGSPTMLAMAQLLQLNDEDLDALFSYAVTVQV